MSDLFSHPIFDLILIQINSHLILFVINLTTYISGSLTISVYVYNIYVIYLFCVCYLYHLPLPSSPSVRWICKVYLITKQTKCTLGFNMYTGSYYINNHAELLIPETSPAPRVCQYTVPSLTQILNILLRLWLHCMIKFTPFYFVLFLNLH